MTTRTRAQWQALFQHHQKSGLSSSEFCKQNNLCPKYFSLRKKQLGFPDAPPFVALQIEAPTPVIQKQNPALTFALGPCHLHFETLPPVEWLSAFLKASA